MSSKNFLMGGKLGDFILSLYAVKNICERDRCKANMYIFDVGWEFGIETAYKDLQPILTSQEYISNFEIIKDYYIDPIQIPGQNSNIQIRDEKIKSEGYVELADYIRSPLLYRGSWSEIYSNLFNFPIKKNYSWISHNGNSDLTKDRILIHRKAAKPTNSKFPFDEIINTYKDQVLFISANEDDYSSFPYKDRLEFLKVSSIVDWFDAINSCSLLISNLSAPITVAHAINKLRIVELTNNLDLFHWINESKYYDTIKWFLSEQNHNIN